MVSGLLFWIVDVLSFPCSGVFTFDLPLSAKLAGLGIAINYTGVFLIVCQFGFSLFRGPLAHMG
jgi:hypothetical protein